MALLTANVTVTFPSLIVISAGILLVTVIIMAMIYTCLLIRILKHSDSYVYFLCSFLRSRIIFTCQSSMPEFCWHDHSRFQEIIFYLSFCSYFTIWLFYMQRKITLIFRNQNKKIYPKQESCHYLG